MLQVKGQVSNRMGTGGCACRAAAGEVCLGCPAFRLQRVRLEETDRQKRNGFRGGNRLWFNPQIPDIVPVNRVMFSLKTEELKRNIRGVLLVYGVQKGLKTFQVVQALRILSGFKNTACGLLRG